MKQVLAVALTMIGLILLLAGGTPAFALESGNLDAAATAEFLGEAAEDFAGSSVSGAGDVNGDGYDDFLVGADNNGNGGLGALTGAGAVYLILGRPSGWSLGKSLGLAPIIKYTGEAAGDQAGRSVAGAGDVNGDGYDDFLVGAPIENAARGAAYLVLGSAMPVGGSLSGYIKYTGEGGSDNAGRSVAGAGDVNGDGYDDFVVGADNNGDGGPGAGAAYLVLGSASPGGGSLSTTIQYTGEAGGDSAGWSVAGAGDVNGDGHTDFLVGSPDHSGGGAVYLVFGNVVPVGGSLSGEIKYTAEAGFAQAGYSVAGAGDVNGDGYDDFLLGAFLNNAGAAYLVLGRASPFNAGLETTIRYTGEVSNDRAGWSVAGAGDVNGDGFDDFLVGARDHGGGGAAYLLLGSTAPTGSSLAAAIKYTGEWLGNAGWSVAGAGDVNGDGYTDILIGDSFNSDGGSFAGAVYLLFSDALTIGADPYRHRTRLSDSRGTVPVTLDQARVEVAFTADALSGGDVAVTRHIVHPCNNALRLQMPIWDVESDKMANTTLVNMRFEYTDGQLGDMFEPNLVLYGRESGKPCSAWTEITSSSVDPATNRVTATGLTGLGQFTIDDSPPSPTAVAMVDLYPALGTSFPGPMFLFTLAALGVGSFVVLWQLRRGRANRDGNAGLETMLAAWLGEKLAPYLREIMEKELARGPKSTGADRQEKQ